MHAVKIVLLTSLSLIALTGCDVQIKVREPEEKKAPKIEAITQELGECVHGKTGRYTIIANYEEAPSITNFVCGASCAAECVRKILEPYD